MLGVVGLVVEALGQLNPYVVLLALSAAVGLAVHAGLRKGRAPSAPSTPMRAQAPPQARTTGAGGTPRTVPTLRGELVASRGEARIADFLHRHGYRYEYEATVCGFRPDFYLPDLDLVIEYWGLDTEEYRERRRVKTAAYLASGFNLIGLERADWSRLEEELKRRMYRFDKDVYRRRVVA